MFSYLLLLVGYCCIYLGNKATGEIILSDVTLETLASANNDILTSNGYTSWYEDITKLFVDGRNSTAAYVSLDVDSLRVSTCDKLTQRIFEPRRNILDELVRKAENIAEAYDWEKDISHVDFKNASEFNDYHVAGESYAGASRFPTTVNFSFSVVHMPVNTYVGDGSVEQDTMRELDWTEDLDEAFREAEEEMRDNPDYEDLMWQYFGSRTGFVRHFPGSQWTPAPTPVDLYDCRRRPWYNRASTPVKEVLILIDKSGSTEGQTIYLSTLTVQKILDTLGEDDFVQVANFSTKERMDNHKARLGPVCFPDFVQATAFNKRVLMNYVKGLNRPRSSRGQANYEVALTYAFKTFEEFSAKSNADGLGMGTNCSKIIIILTDGGVEKPTALIYDADPEGTKYRIFTFAMGKAPTPLEAVKWLACETNGFFSMINGINTIDAGIQSYSNRLSLAVAQSSSQPKSLLSSIYRDDWEYTKALSMPGMYNASIAGQQSMLQWSYPDPELGLGMLTTLTKQVYNKADPANVSLLGVVGVDIAVDELNKFIPFRELGPLSYTMVVNHNGFVIMHPLLKLQEKWNVEPPSVDMLDVEMVVDQKTLDNEITEIRKRLLNGQEAAKKVNGVGAVLKGGENYDYFIHHTTQNYFTENIKTTRYSVAMAHPDIINNVLMVNYTEGERPDVDILRDLKDEKYEVTVSKWRYCKEVFRITNQSLVLDSLIDIIGDNVSCDAAMVDHLLWDASIIKSSDLKSLVTDTDAEAVSITTAGGLTVMYPDGYYYPNEKTSFRFGSHYSEPATKRAFARRDITIYATEHVTAGQSADANLTISIYKAINDEGDDGPYIFGVLGITVNSSILSDTLLSVEDSNGDSLCDSMDNRCFLLDEGGFIIYEDNAEDDYNYAGMWLGTVDPSLMHALYNESDDSIYRRHKFYDYQATCIFNWLEVSRSAAPRMPVLNDMVEMLFTQVFSLLSVLYSSIVMYGSGIEAVRPLEYGERYEVCTMMSYQYYYDDVISKAEFSTRAVQYEESSCLRSGTVVKVEGTNLLLVIANNPDYCNGVQPLPQAPVEIPYDGYTTENPSVCTRHLRERIPPTQCLNAVKGEAPCRGCERAAVSQGLLLAALLVYRALQ